MTPHRWFSIEHHTTELPLINYLPDKIAYSVTKNFSKRTDPIEFWQTYLRRGIRGGTENEIIKILQQDSEHRPKLLEPSQKNLKDRIDLWYSQLNEQNYMAVKKGINYLMKTMRVVSGATLVPNLSLVIKKLNH